MELASRLAILLPILYSELFILNIYGTDPDPDRRPHLRRAR
jgi:hypothetical protein